MKFLFSINDVIWVVVAILCVFFDHPILTALVMVTTAIYTADLVMKFKALHWRLIPFLKVYWLDILFLVPFVKIFRGLRIIKVGKILRAVDATCDFTEIAFRIKNAVLSRKSN